MYKYLFKSLLSVLLCVYPEVELMDPMVMLHLIFWGTAHSVFHISCTILHSHHPCTGVPVPPYPCQQLLFSVLLKMAILLDVKSYLIVILICILEWLVMLSAFFFFFIHTTVRRRSLVFYLFIYLFIYLLAVLSLRFCARAFPSCGKQGPLFIAVRRPLTVAASLVAEHRLQTRRLSNCGSRA